MTAGYSDARRSPFELSELAAFDKNIEGCSDEERRRKRMAYIEQNLVQLGYGKSIFKGIGCLMIPMLIVPLFWPVAILMWFMKKKAFEVMDTQISAALRYWDIDRSELNVAVT